MKSHLLLPLLTIGMLISCSKKTASSSSAYELKTDHFPAFIANPGTLNIVDFSASWCPPCQQLKPILESIAKEHSGTVQLGVVDVDTEKQLAAQQAVRGIPDVRFYINGKLVDKFSGAAPKRHIEQLIAKHSKNVSQADPETGSKNSPAIDSPPAPGPGIQPAKENPLAPGMMRE